MIHARRSLPSPDFFENASAAQRVAGVSRLILHAPIDFLRFEDLLAVGKSDADALADRVIIFALKRQNVGQKGLDTLVHRVHRLLVAGDIPKIRQIAAVGRQQGLPRTA